MAKILLAEDDLNLGAVIVDNLQHSGYDVTLSKDGHEALEKYHESTYDLCILDVMLPKQDGFSVAQHIRKENTQIPILFLTAKSMEEDRLEGFKSGGDDYITKPFSMKEIIYRIEVFLKRAANSQAIPKKEFIVGRYTFDYPNLELSLGTQTFTLTQKEAEVLKYMCENQNRVLKRNEILKAVWDSDDYFLGRSMDVFISKLRKHLQQDPSVSITNVHGVGFKFEIS